MTNNLELYKVFYYVAKTGSLTKAANELSISQPAVSQSMKQLEKVLNAKLLKRTAKGVKLTDEGLALFPYIEKGYESILQGEKKLESLISLTSGTITIGVSDMTLKSYLLPFIANFHKEYPKIKINLISAPSMDTIKALDDGLIDFGLISSLELDRDDLTFKELGEIQDIFVAGSGFSHLKNQQLPYQLLAHLPLICLDKNTITRQYIDSFFENNHISISPEFELENMEMLVNFTKRNLGIGCVVKEYVLDEIEAGSLFPLSFFPEIPKRHISLVTKDNIPLSPAAKALIGALE